MKRIITYISILAAVLTAGVSCSREATLGEQESGKLSLYFQTAEMSTRVTIKDGTPVAGVGAENTIDHIDYFFFANEDKTSAAIVSGRATSDQLEKVSDTEYKYDGFDTSLSQYEALKAPSYLYVLVNYPEEVTATTMEQLLALPISTDFTKEQTSFVMDSFENSGRESGLIYLAPKSNAERREAVVKVTRVAAKLVLNFRVAETITDPTDDVWTPVLDQMWVNFLHARKTATVAGAQMPFDTKDNYYNTEQAAPSGGTLTTETEGEGENAVTKKFYEYTTDPVYTYPQSYKSSDVTAPYFKIFLPWISQKKGQNNFYYKIILPETMKGFQRNKIYQLNVDVSVIGGTEDEWALFSDYVYVADWYSPGEIATTVESARYLDVAVKEYEIYGINSITVPVVSSNNIRIVSIEGMQQRVQETDRPIEQAHSKTPRAVSYEANGKESFTVTYDLDATITTSNNTSFDCTPIVWTVKIQHVPTADEPYLDKIVTVKITQYPAIYAYLKAGLNSFVNGYYTVQTASVTPRPNTETQDRYYRWGGGTMAGTGGNNTNNNYGGLNTSWTSGGKDRTTTMTLINVTAFSADQNSYTVQSANGNSASDGQSTKEYIIADPRITPNPAYTQNSLNPYLWGNSTQTWTDAAAGTIKIGTNSRKNLIAPAFMFNSEMAGRPGTSSNLNFERATKRCATYQEAGYPAGRWRLPTEAEIYFAYSLQRMNVIDNLFNGGDGYWASSGNCFADNSDLGQGTQAQQDAVMYSFRYRPNENHSVRCVYDIWYWGETAPAENVHTFYPGTLN